MTHPIEKSKWSVLRKERANAIKSVIDDFATKSGFIISKDNKWNVTKGYRHWKRDGYDTIVMRYIIQYVGCGKYWVMVRAEELLDSKSHTTVVFDTAFVGTDILEQTKQSINVGIETVEAQVAKTINQDAMAKNSTRFDRLRMIMK